MGGLYSRPVCKRWCAVLLQAVGWLAQETCRKEAGRGDLRRVSSETPESRVPRCGLSPVGGGHRAQVFGVNASPDHSIWNLSEGPSSTRSGRGHVCPKSGNIPTTFQ